MTCARARAAHRHKERPNMSFASIAFVGNGRYTCQMDCFGEKWTNVSRKNKVILLQCWDHTQLSQSRMIRIRLRAIFRMTACCPYIARAMNSRYPYIITLRKFYKRLEGKQPLSSGGYQIRRPPQSTIHFYLGAIFCCGGSSSSSIPGCAS